MGPTIYRSQAGREAVRSWCAHRLASADVAHETISTQLGETSVATLGDGRDVVLIPGTNFSAATCLSTVTSLAQEHRVFALDVPGQPGLSAPRRPRDRHRYGKWLAEVIERLDLAEPVVIGQSLGGRIALAGELEGADIGGLALVNPAGLIRLRVGPRILATTIRWLVMRDQRASAALLDRMAAPGAQIEPEIATWMTLVARHVRTSLAPPPFSTTTLSRITCPVRLVTGVHDPFLPSRPLVAAFSSVADEQDATVIASAGHLVPEEAPRELARVVRELTSLSSS